MTGRSSDGGEPKPKADASADTVAAGAASTADTVLPDTVLPGAAVPDTVSPRSGAGVARPDYPDLVPVSPEHYVLDREIARGGMGRIRVARDRRLGRPVAVKEILVKAGDAARRFEREARITARLQHPSIVNVHEAGVWPSGEPFYAMKLVTGRPLDDVVADTKTLAERLALLPNVLAVADAMAYAHGERVIHRDLKPRNVLVGAFGETVVIDWGLAKDLAATDAPADSAGPFRSSGGGAETVVGDVMGTPAYMPPEQAEGRTVDERADVYAIGAILDHVLSGKPPYTGASGVEILETVKRAAPVPLLERQPGVPPDLLAIIGRAMARDAAARYPTARELADDLRRYQTGQLVGAHHYSLGQLLRRWLRRHRAPVSVAAAAALVLLVVGVVALRRIVRAERLAEERRAQAEQQRTLAQESRGEAEELLGFMLGDLRHKLEPVGRLDVLDDVAKKAIAYYDRRGAGLSDAELAKRALARRNLGDVLRAQGHADAALAEYRASLAINEALAAKDPADVAYQRALGADYDHVGDMLLQQGDTAGAFAAHHKQLEIAEALAAKAPNDAAVQRDVSVAHDNLGDVLVQQGDTPGALAEYRADLAIAAALAAKHPADADLQHDAAISHYRVGNMLLAQGDAAGALAEYRTSISIHEALAAQDPRNAEWQRALSLDHNKIANVLLAQGDKEGALAEYRAGLAISVALAEKDPTNAERQRDAAVFHGKVGGLLLKKGDTAGALAEYRTSLAIREALAARDPKNAKLATDLALGHEMVGDVLLAQDDNAGGLAEYRAEWVILEALAAQDPANVDRQRALAVADLKVGDGLRYTGDLKGAMAEYRAAQAIFATLAAQDPSNVDRQVDLAAGHESAGDALVAAGDTTGARTEYQAAIAILEPLKAKVSRSADVTEMATALASKLAKCCAQPTPRRVAPDVKRSGR